jgi:hypothetical protein
MLANVVCYGCMMKKNLWLIQVENFMFYEF